MINLLLYGTLRLLLSVMSVPLTEVLTETERKPSLVDAYAALKDAIRQGVLPSGYQGSEQEIAGKLNMSRTPVHEAIVAQRALVRIHAGGDRGGERGCVDVATSMSSICFGLVFRLQTLPTPIH